VTTDRGRDASRPLFFLSYAHSAPLAGSDPEPADSGVEEFFNDLSREVRRLAGLAPDAAAGFFDGVLSPGEDWRVRTTWALERVHCFVPLYSSSYFRRSWPGREWRCFSMRLPGGMSGPPDEHIVPVLWAPLLWEGERPAAPEPVGLDGPDDPGGAGDAGSDYAENGLQALSMLSFYREDYVRIVRLVAERIDRVVRDHPLAVGSLPPMDGVTSAFETSERDFAVVVAAPRSGTLPEGRAGQWYGKEEVGWCPFGKEERLPLADHAVSFAERLDFSTRVLPVGAAAAAADEDSAPALVLIDPWILEQPGGEQGPEVGALRALYRGPRRAWTIPVIVANPRDRQSAQRAGALTERLSDILADVGAPKPGAARRTEGAIESIEDFAARMPGLVAEAERRYVRYSPVFGGGAGGPGRDGATEESDG
jgi:FxsC-like protein